MRNSDNEELQAQIAAAQGKITPFKTVRQDMQSRQAAQKAAAEIMEKLSPAEVDLDEAEKAADELVNDPSQETSPVANSLRSAATADPC